MRYERKVTPIITALILVQVMASVLGQLGPPVVGFLRRVVGVPLPSPVILLSWGSLPLVLGSSASFLATSKVASVSPRFVRFHWSSCPRFPISLDVVQEARFPDSGFSRFQFLMSR